ncbi:hypothetical protein CDIK_2490 [Cucumispora dikerogammari]|nr:hypothetical protein CDIK_2490 [Cucumispora dikerogammari]
MLLILINSTSSIFYFEEDAETAIRDRFHDEFRKLIDVTDTDHEKKLKELEEMSMCDKEFILGVSKNAEKLLKRFLIRFNDNLPDKKLDTADMDRFLILIQHIIKFIEHIHTNTLVIAESKEIDFCDKELITGSFVTLPFIVNVVSSVLTTSFSLIRLWYASIIFDKFPDLTQEQTELIEELLLGLSDDFASNLKPHLMFSNYRIVTTLCSQHN